MYLPVRRFIVVAIVQLAVYSAATAQERPEPGHWSCYTEYGQPTVYTTGVWDGTALMQEVTNAFSQFLLTKYGYQGQVFCGRATMTGSTTAKLMEGDHRRNAQWTANGKRVVETNFTFDPATASLAYACVGFTRVMLAPGQFADSVFVSPVIRIPGSSDGPLSTAWSDYLKLAHPGGPMTYPAGCILLLPDPARHQAEIDNMPSAYNSPHPVIVRVEWNYQP